MLTVVYWSIALSLALNGIMFLLAFRLKSDKLTDISYALTFVALAVFAFMQSQQRTYDILALALVTVWAIRIGGFLLYRVLRVGKDRRFDDMRDSFWKFGKFWLGQAITVWVLMLPITLALTGKQAGHIVLLAVTLWLVGLSIEAIADAQKYRFTSNPAHKGQWIESGIWRYSRHPNYFGEILVWVGVYVYCLPALTLTGKIISLSSPLFITALLLFVSGIPILERGADKRWGSDPAYQQYKRRTSLLVPLPKKSL